MSYVVSFLFFPYALFAPSMSSKCDARLSKSALASKSSVSRLLSLPAVIPVLVSYFFAGPGVGAVTNPTVIELLPSKSNSD